MKYCFNSSPPLPIMIINSTLCTWLFSASQQSIWNIYIPDPLTLSLAMGLALAIEVLVNRHSRGFHVLCMVWLGSLSSCHLPWKEPDLGTCSSKNIPRGIQNRLEPDPNPEANFSCPEAWSRVTYQPADPRVRKISVCTYKPLHFGGCLLGSIFETIVD